MASASNQRRLRQRRSSATDRDGQRRLPTRSRTMVLSLAALVILAATGGILARVSRSRAVSPAGRTTQIRAASAPGPSNPSKEYIYEGDRLVAEEEGTPNPTPTPPPTTPALSSVTPASGNPGSNVSVTIAGTNLGGANPTITFSNPQAITGTIGSVTQVGGPGSINYNILAAFDISPTAPLGTYTFTVTVGGIVTNALNFSVVSAGSPQIASLSPNQLYIGSINTMKIQGQFLSGTSNVGFSTQGPITTSNIVVVGDTEVDVTVNVPSNTNPGSNGVFVVTPAGKSPAFPVTLAYAPVQPPPVINSLSPNPWIASQNAGTLTINGSNFVTGASVQIDSSSYQPSTLSGTQITISSLIFSLAGFHSVMVINPPPGGNMSAADSNVFTLQINNPVPIMNSIASGATQVTGGNSGTVTINGLNFVNASNGGELDRTMAWVNGTAASNRRTTNVPSANQLTLTLIASDLAGTGTLSITISNPGPGGGPTTSAALSVNVVNPAPQFTGVSPGAVPQNYSQNFNLTLTGTKVMTGAMVKVAGQARTPSSISSTQVVIPMTPADVTVAGTVSITVTNPSPNIGPGVANIVVNPPGVCSLTSTLSGDGNYAYLDAVGTSAEWAAPLGCVAAKDPASGYRCLFVCDTDNQRIRLVYLEGPNMGLSVAIAGTGVAGYDPGGGPALQTRLNSPRGICARKDSNGNLLVLYVADTRNQMIRELIPNQPYSNTNWLLGQFCGNGVAGLVDGEFDGCEFNNPRGIFTGIDNFIYVADTSNQAIRQLDFSGDAYTIVQSSSLSPFGITGSPNSKLLYFTDLALQGVYSVTTSGANLTAIAGNGTAGSTNGTGASARFFDPTELCWTTDPTDGEVLYIPDFGNQTIRKLVISTAAVTTFAGTGTAGHQDGACGAALFSYPRCITTGLTTEMYVTDTSNNRIRTVQ